MSNSDHIFISHRLAVIATRKMFLLSLILKPKFCPPPPQTHKDTHPALPRDDFSQNRITLSLGQKLLTENEADWLNTFLMLPARSSYIGLRNSFLFSWGKKACIGGSAKIVCPNTNKYKLTHHTYARIHLQPSQLPPTPESNLQSAIWIWAVERRLQAWFNNPSTVIRCDKHVLNENQSYVRYNFIFYALARAAVNALASYQFKCNIYS